MDLSDEKVQVKQKKSYLFSDQIFGVIYPLSQFGILKKKCGGGYFF